MDTAKLLKQLNSKEKRMLSLVCILSVASLIGWLGFAPDGILTDHTVKKQTVDEKAENERLKEDNRRLQAKIDRIKNDPAYLEEISRLEYHLLKKNEIVFEFK